MYRFFIAPELIQGSEVFLPSDLAHQLGRVLRLRDGDRILLLDNSGIEHVVSLHSFERRSVQGTILESRPNLNEPDVKLTLYLSILKGKKPELVFQKGTELGVSRFVPVVTQRSVIGSVDDLSDAKLDRWEAIVREAAEQSGRGLLPQVSAPVLFDVALSEARTSRGLTLIPWEAGGQDLRELLQAEGTHARRINLFIGPEGGFEEDEVIHARAYGAHPVSLGPRILRAETAAIAATAVVFFALGEWRLQ